ncbi:phage scaffolding protein [Paenibacillus sp. FSL K6-2524]|uniref:phage scaffolding protein n=1 Tax=Paenibacillus sp. FSL K6-2524 TaxID=2954516 RepID=UPI0030F9604B
MTKEEFIALGFTEEQATKAAEASLNELKTFIPKHRFDELTEENKTLKATVKENGTQLETLGKTAGLSEDLQKEIQRLQDENKTAATEHESTLKKLKLDNAIKLAITGKVHDEDMAISQLDATRLVVSDDGKVVGLDEQITTLKTSKAFLFKEDSQQQQQPPGIRVGAPRTELPAGGQLSLGDAIAAHFTK